MAVRRPIRSGTSSAFALAGALTGSFALGCAREALPPELPATPLVWQLPSHLARIPPPVAPYSWPDPGRPLQLVIPQWAGVAAAPFAATVQRAAIYYQLPPELIWAVMKVESDFRYTAVSRAWARGLMQLMPSTAAAIGVRDPLDPEQNILGGAYYLRHLANRYRGNVVFTLAAYNAGPGAVRRHGGIPPYPETQSYIRKVLSYYAHSVLTPL